MGAGGIVPSLHDAFTGVAIVEKDESVTPVLDGASALVLEEALAVVVLLVVVVATAMLSPLFSTKKPTSKKRNPFEIA